jgi:plastocyanin
MSLNLRSKPRSARLAPAGVALAVAFAACTSSGAPPTSPAPTTVDVFTPGNVFSPFSITVGVGSTVRFNISRAPDGTGHNAIFGATPAGAPADINIVADTVVSRVFGARGTFEYICTVHPGMTGEVVVK